MVGWGETTTPLQSGFNPRTRTGYDNFAFFSMRSQS